MANELDYIDLGLSCAEVCDALGQGLKGKRLDELDQPVLGAIGKLTTYVGASMRVRAVCSPTLQSQDFGRDGEEDHQDGQTEYCLSTSACEER